MPPRDDSLRRGFINEHFAAWEKAKPQVPASSKDWTREHAKAVFAHIRAFDTMMHQLGLCPPKAGIKKGALEVCCSVSMDAYDARAAERRAAKKAAKGAAR